MSTPTSFPRVTGRSRGYEVEAVDQFLAAAQSAYEAGSDSPRSDEIRTVAFRLVKGGYQPAPVDAALGRIEDALAAREREQALSLRGAKAWLGRSQALAQEVLDRLQRPAGERFDRVGFLRWGYRIDEVDIVADRIAGFLRDGTPLTAEQVRTVAFRMQRGGYREAQVDAVLDAVIEVTLAVR